jgi:hypothetical protein
LSSLVAGCLASLLVPDHRDHHGIGDRPGWAWLTDALDRAAWRRQHLAGDHHG